MSASSKKKLRKEQEAAFLTEKQLAEQKEAKKLKIYTITFVAIMALVVAIGLGTIIGNTVSNSGIIERGTTSLTVGEHKLNAVELNYYYMSSINSFYSSLSSCRITSLSHGSQNVGRIAAEALMQLLEGKPAQSQTVPWVLAEKESS
jgi:hypothetical protein